MKILHTLFSRYRWYRRWKGGTWQLKKYTVSSIGPARIIKDEEVLEVENYE